MRRQASAYVKTASCRRRGGNLHTIGRALLIFATASLPFIFGVASASAAPRQVIAYFGAESGTGTLGGQFEYASDVAVNSAGAGPADPGDIYAIDSGGNNRIQRFAQDDNGTAAFPYDDSFPFVSAWGVDVDATTTGDSGYEVCTVAASCKPGVLSGGNGAASGNGAIRDPKGITVDEDTGNVYVVDSGNSRVNVYAGGGVFLRSFGFDVAASGPGNTGTGFEVCVAANGDVCKAGTAGAGVGQLGSGGARGIAISPADGNAASGTVFIADRENGRINTYKLDGTSPSSFGTAADFVSDGPFNLAVDSRGIVYAEGGSQSSNWIIARYDSQNANGGGVGFLAQISIPPLVTSEGGQVNAGLEVDPDSDGGGLDTDVLYALRGLSGGKASPVQQFGPLNSPGLTAPPGASDDSSGLIAHIKFASGLGLDALKDRLFVAANNEVNGEPAKSGVYVLDKAGGVPATSLESVSNIAATSVVLHGKVDPNGPPDAGYRVEYSLDGVDWITDPGTIETVGSQETPQDVSPTLSPPGGGLQPNTLYHARLVATRPFNPPVVSNELTFTTATAAPLAETTGSPLRTTTTALLQGRISPSNSPASFHFEYGSEGPCSTNACSSTESVSAGPGNVYQLASAEISELQPNTTYHYRIVADNGQTAFGEDMTVTTRATEAPLSHGQLPGPPGSDRAYEQVTLPDTGGNPVNAGVAFSDDGNRAIYITSGGNPSSPVGGFRSLFFAEREETAAHQGAWQSSAVMPPREELAGSNFNQPTGPDDLSSFTVTNFAVAATQRNLWRLSSSAPAQQLFEPVSPQEYRLWYVGADDSTRVVTRLKGGTLDPAFPTATAKENLYDVSTGTPKLASLLPGNVVSSCSVGGSSQAFGFDGEEGLDTRNWLSADGLLLFFPSCSNLYMRELAAEQTKFISGPPLSGSQCGAALVKSTADAAFFWTKTRLSAEDSNPADCSSSSVDGDVYRYDIVGGERECLTCVAEGLDADVYFPLDDAFATVQRLTVAEDGSRVYFQSPHRLVPGAPALSGGAGNGSVYRVNVQSGDVRWIAGPEAQVGDFAQAGTSITPDGKVIVFRAQDASLNPQGVGSDNGGTFQYYRYDDSDRSLVCVSCPPDGAAAERGALKELLSAFAQVGSNTTPLSEDGDFAFSTTEALARRRSEHHRGRPEPQIGHRHLRVARRAPALGHRRPDQLAEQRTAGAERRQPQRPRRLLHRPDPIHPGRPRRLQPPL